MAYGVLIVCMVLGMFFDALHVLFSCARVRSWWSSAILCVCLVVFFDLFVVSFVGVRVTLGSEDVCIVLMRIILLYVRLASMMGILRVSGFCSCNLCFDHYTIKTL